MPFAPPLFGDNAFSQGIIKILKYGEVDVYFPENTIMSG